MNLKRVIHEICPPIAWTLATRLRRSPQGLDARGDNVFTGDYASWTDAAGASGGYAAPDILEKTRAALLKVKRGEATFERDSVILPDPEYPFPVIAGLLRAALAENDRLSVLDFGGALGSTYFQCRKLLGPVKQLRWSVVEQAAHVACGRTEFETDELTFYTTVDECLRAERPRVLLLSSVLQYLSEPHAFFANILGYPFGHVIVDRTTVFKGQTPDRLTVQHVPAWIYPASYPCWMLNYRKLLDLASPAYMLVAEFPAHIGTTIPFDGVDAAYAGFLLERKTDDRHRHEE